MSVTAATGKVYKLHPESEGFLKIKSENGTPSYDVLSVEDARKLVSLRGADFAGEIEYDGSSVDIVVPSPDSPDGIPISVYSPRNKPARPTILLYFHGGGFVIFSRKEFGTMLKIISQKSGCIAVNVEYRLAPEHKIPAAFEDGRCVAEWMMNNKEAVGGCKYSTVGVGGDSAGGCITAFICQVVRGIAYQILIYPSIDDRSLLCPRPNLPSRMEFVKGPILEIEVINWFGNHSIPGGTAYAPDVMQHNANYSSLPPTISIIAEIDPLRDGGIEYHENIKAAGVLCELHVMKGAIHGYINLCKHYKDLCEDSYNIIAAFVGLYSHNVPAISPPDAGI